MGATCFPGLGWGFPCLDPHHAPGTPRLREPTAQAGECGFGLGPEASDPGPNQARLSVSEPSNLVAVQRSLARQRSHS